MASTIQLKRGSASDWLTANPVLAEGEPGYETDTGRQKIGDGATPWVSLNYSEGGISASGGTDGGRADSVFAGSIDGGGA